MKALIHENTHIVLDPMLNWQPVQLITNIGNDVFKLPLAQNDSCGGAEHILQRLDMISTCVRDDTVTVVYPATDKCMDHGLGGIFCK